MSVPAELGKYSDEEDFREHFLIPLFHRLGYSVVVNTHGQREFGRDIIFGDIDKFGHFNYSGLQAKFEISIGLGKKIDDLKSDVSQAFDTRFTHPHTGEEQRISRFYIANAGSFSDQAREAFFGGLHQPSVRANTRVLDGKGLIALDKWASYNRGEYVKEQLTGLIFEFRYNDIVLSALINEMPKFVEAPLEGVFPIDRCRLEAVSGLLQKPVLVDIELISLIERYWQIIRAINYVADSIGAELSRQEFREARLASFNSFAQEMIVSSLLMQTKITEILRCLEPMQPI